ncbi:hypothetical protein ACSBR2_002340 [Camellia fascicularis]
MTVLVNNDARQCRTAVLEMEIRCADTMFKCISPNINGRTEANCFTWGNGENVPERPKKRPTCEKHIGCLSDPKSHSPHLADMNFGFYFCEL